MFIDIHVHPAFFEPINEDPLREEMRHRALDIHKNGTSSIQHVLNQMNCAGLDRLCLLAQDYSADMGTEIVSNQEVRRLVDLIPDRFIGFASVDPRDPEAPEKLEYAIAELKLNGLNLHPGRVEMDPCDIRMERLYDICEKHDVPVMFHAGLSWEPGTHTEYGMPIRFENLAMERPGLRFCLGHFGWPWVRETAMLMLKYPNVYADTGVLYFDSALEFYRTTFTEDIPVTWIDRSLRHQVLFGSDNPRFEQIRMAKALDRLGMRESTVELIKGQNALDFLGMKGET